MKNPQRKTKQRTAIMHRNSFDPLDFIDQYKLGSQNESEKIKKRKQIEGEAIAKAIKNAQDDSFGSFATKDDLDKLELSMKVEISKVESRINKVETSLDAKIDKVEISIRKDMQIMEKSLTIKIAAIVVGALGFFQLLGKIII